MGFDYFHWIMLSSSFTFSKKQVLLPESIHQLFIFNSKYAGKREDEEYLKVLYFYPNSTRMEDQERSVGLSEALIQFTSNFSPNQPCEYMFNEKRKHVYLQVEPGYWMIMSVNKDQNEVKEESENFSSKSGQDFLKNLLKACYSNFKLHNSSMESIVKDKGVDQLRLTLKEHFNKNMDILKRRVESLDHMDLFPGLNFLPVDGAVFLMVQSMMNQLMDKYQDIKSGIFHYEDSLVFTSLSHEDVLAVYSRESSLDKIVISNVEFCCQIIQFQKVKLMIFSSKKVDADEVKKYLENEIQILTQTISDNLMTSPGYDEMFKYIYYNHMNLSVKTSIKKNTKEVLEAIASIKNDFKMSREGLKEVYVRPRKDLWIVAYSFGEREFYQIFENKQNSLIEINEHFRKAKKLFSVKLKK